MSRSPLSSPLPAGRDTLPAEGDRRRDGAEAARAAASNGRGEDRAVRNFVLLAAHQSVMRTGWIFKTESIVMPAVLDSLSGAAWLRGCLPMLNRFGQSVPPLLFAGYVTRLSRKKFFLAACSLAMGGLFLFLAACWTQYGAARQASLPWIFLAIYAAFFAAVGLQQLALGTLTGKLVAARRRGALMTWANGLGGVTAILCAWLLLRPWLDGGPRNFDRIFLFSGCLFLAAAAVAAALAESTDRPTRAVQHSLANALTALRQVRRDRNLALVGLMSLLYGTSITLFPHYQALGRIRLELGLSQLVPWLIVQNVGVSLFSLPVGRVADHFGNRLALRGLMLVSVGAPLAAIAFSHQPAWGPAGFLGVFSLLGFMPITMRVFAHYALEIASGDQQPNYLAVVNLAMSVPAITAAPLVGWAIDLFGFEPCFFAIAALLVAAFAIGRWLEEPRDKPAPAPTPWEPPLDRD